jgi:hypothetical protein
MKPIAPDCSRRWAGTRKNAMRRGIGLGPERDFSSHAADAFGLMCGAYEPPRPLLSQSITVPSFGVV